MSRFTVQKYIRQMLLEADEQGIEVPATAEMMRALEEAAASKGSVPVKTPDGKSVGNATSGGDADDDVRPTLATLIDAAKAQAALDNYASLKKNAAGESLGAEGAGTTLSQYLLNADAGGLALLQDFAQGATAKDGQNTIPFNQAFAAISIKAPEAGDIALNALADDLVKTAELISLIYGGRGLGIFSTPAAVSGNAALFTLGQKIIIALPSIAVAYELLSEPEVAEDAKQATAGAREAFSGAPEPGSANESRHYRGGRGRYSLLQILQEAPGAISDEVEGILTGLLGAQFVGTARRGSEDAIKQLISIMILGESKAAKEAMDKVFLRIREIEKTLPIPERIANESDFESFVKKYKSDIITPELVNSFSESILAAIRSNGSKKLLKDIESINRVQRSITDLDELINAMPEDALLGRELIARIRTDAESRGAILTAADVMSLAKKLGQNAGRLQPDDLYNVKDSLMGAFNEEFAIARFIDDDLARVKDVNLSEDSGAQDLSALNDAAFSLISKMKSNAGLSDDTLLGLSGLKDPDGNSVGPASFTSFDIDDTDGKIYAQVFDGMVTARVDASSVSRALVSGIDNQMRTLSDLLDALDDTIAEQSNLVIARINEETATLSSDAWADLIVKGVKASGEDVLDLSAKALRSRSIGNFFQRGTVIATRSIIERLAEKTSTWPARLGRGTIDFLLGAGKILGKLWNPRIAALAGSYLAGQLQDKFSGSVVFVGSISKTVAADIVASCSLYHRRDLFVAAAANARKISAAISRVYKGGAALPVDNFGTTKTDTLLADSAITAWNTLANNLDAAVKAIDSVAPLGEGEEPPQFEDLTIKESLRIFIRESLRRH